MKWKFLGKIHTTNPELPVIIMTAYSSVHAAVDAIKHGAHDYLTKPLDFDRLRLTLERAADRKQVGKQTPGALGKKSELRCSLMRQVKPHMSVDSACRYRLVD